MAFKPDKSTQGEQTESKQDRWDKTMAGLDMIVDKLGHPIDKGIKETVCAFGVNDFPAFNSCEGHVEDREGEILKLSPYVGIGIEEPKQRYVDQSEILNLIAAQFKIKPEEIKENSDATKAFWDYIIRKKSPETAEYLEARAQNESMQKKMEEIFNSFYQGRERKDGRQMCIKKIGPCGHFYVTSQNNKNSGGVRIVPPEKVPEAEKEIDDEKKEFVAFTEFMKGKFFNGE